MLAWLTPDSSDFSQPQDSRCITVPGALWSYVSGCLLLLAESENWEQFGTATPEETAGFFTDIFDEYLNSICGGGMDNSGVAFNQIIDKSSSNGDSPTTTILQSSLPIAAQGCKGIMCYFNWSSDKDMFLQFSTAGNLANGFVILLDPLSNGAIQLIIPMDETGGKISLSATGGLSSWTIDAFLVSWWF